MSGQGTLHCQQPARGEGTPSDQPPAPGESDSQPTDCSFFGSMVIPRVTAVGVTPPFPGGHMGLPWEPSSTW